MHDQSTLRGPGSNSFRYNRPIDGGIAFSGMPTDRELCDELACYTLAHADPAFLHQHVMDAFAAQNADETCRPIGVWFALVGLYLFIEKGFTGRQVQRIHMQLANRRKQWPRLTPPQDRGKLTVSAVLAALPGPERDAKIREWCGSVWGAWGAVRDQIKERVKAELNIV